jgi:hypothetical protein
VCKTRLPNGHRAVQAKASSAAKGGNMKKLFALVVLTGCLAIPSFAADVVVRSAKVAGKDSAKVAKVTVKDSAKAVTAVGKFLF